MLLKADLLWRLKFGLTSMELVFSIRLFLFSDFCFKFSYSFWCYLSLNFSITTGQTYFPFMIHSFCNSNSIFFTCCISVARLFHILVNIYGESSFFLFHRFFCHLELVVLISTMLILDFIDNLVSFSNK